MAQELELIVDMLREMREANRANSQGFDKLLASIEVSIKMTDKNSSAADLLKVYIEELAKAIDEKLSTTAGKFTTIETAAKTIKKHVKNKETKSLIDVFSKNIKNLSPAKQNDILTKIKETENSSDAVNILKNNLDELNLNYQNTIDNLSSDVKNIITAVYSNEIDEVIQAQLDVINDSIYDIVNNLNSYERRDANLEKLLSEITTSESLKLTQGVIDSIIEKNNEISEKFSTLANKSDIEEIITETDSAQVKLFTEISNKTDSIESLTEDIKKALAKVTQDMENLPDTNLLKDSMQELFVNLNELSSVINNANLNDNFSDVDNKLSALNYEMSTIKNIINDLNDVVTSKIYGIVNDISFEKESFDIKSHVSKMLSELPHKQDIDKLLEVFELNRNSLKKLEERTGRITDQLQFVADSNSVEKLSSKTDDIKNMIETLNFDDEFDNLYNKTAEIKGWLSESNVKENSEEILSKIESKSEQKETLAILETVEKIVMEIDELSKNMDVKKVNRTVAEVYQIIEELKNDFITTTDSHNNNIIEKLSSLQKTVSKVVKKEDFEDFTSDLKTFVEQTVSNTSETNSNFVDIRNYQDIIIDKLNNIDIYSVKEYISEQILPIEEKLVTMSEYLNALGEKEEARDIKDIITQQLEPVYQKLESMNQLLDSLDDKEEDIDIKAIIVNQLEPVYQKLDSMNQLLGSLDDKEEIPDLKDIIVNQLEPVYQKLDSMNQLLNSLEDKEEGIDIKDVIANQIAPVDEKLVTISEYLSSLDKTNSNDIIEFIAEIKEILENKKSNFADLEKNNVELAKSVENYLNDIKIILKTSDKDLNTDLTAKFSQIEQLLFGYQSTNENALTEIITKLDDYQNNINTQDTVPVQEIQTSFAEISDIKNRITELSESFKALNYEKGSTEDNISYFVSEKLQELSLNLEQLTEDFDTKLQHGFAYNAELIEEKTLVLLDFIKELRHANSNNIELYERLTVTDNKLMDFKQELELINTDVINNLNSKTDILLQQLEPINEILSKLSLNQDSSQNENVKNHLEVLHDSIQEDLAECSKYSKSTFDKLENTYEQISKELSTTENNLRDFILGDIDSVIIKIDNLRSDLEENLTKIAPPEAEHMAEFKVFVDQINSFKTEQLEIIEKTSQEIKDSINENINAKHEELKSMLTVSLNNKEIITAIDSLKACLKAKIKEFDQVLTNEPEILGTNEFEEAFETDKNSEIVEDIKKDFDKFAILISELSDKNPEINEVLNVIKSKMETITVAKPVIEDFPEIIEDEDYSDAEFSSEENEDADETLIGCGNFDFIKALDLLKQDINNLHKDVEKIISKEEQKQAASTLKTIPTLGNDKLLLSLNNKIELLANSVNQKDWLEEIKTYIAGDQIQSMLEEISGKIDILTLTDNTEWVDEIKQALDQINNNSETVPAAIDPHIQSMLTLINEKIDILAAADDYELIEEVRDAIEKLDLSSEVNKTPETHKLLNIINEKIDILASGDNTEDFEDIKDSLITIEEKLDSKGNSEDFNDIKNALVAIETKLSKNTVSETLNNLDDIKNTLGSIEKKLDIDTTAETLDNLDDIKSTLSTIEEKLNNDTTSETLNSLDDIKYTLLNVDEKVDSVKKLSETDAKITSMLEALNHKIDSIAESESAINIQEFSDVKDLIMAQTDYIENLEKNDKTDALKKCLKELTLEVNNLVTSDSTKQIKKTIRDMKESILAAVVTIFEQVSFVEETEDIKDFVEEKTDEINQNLVTVTNQLKQITNANEDPDYVYSMQDIESDLAKLRLALNQLQTSEQETQTERLSSILENINNIGSTVEDLQNSLTKEEFFDLKVKFDNVNTDIKSLNALTHQLITTSDKSYAELNSNFEDFGKVITTQLSTKVDRVTKLLETSHASDKVMRQALIYMGEWIDSASESMNKISSNSEEIIDIKSAIEGLKQSVPEQTDILNSIEEKFDEQQERLAYFEKQISKLGGLEDKFEAQQERIDRLEMSLEKILSAVEDIDDSKVTRKIDKIDKQLAKLSTNIEKLTSYVD